MAANKLIAISLACLVTWSGAAAEPYLAVQEGYHCGTCHVSASGGGMRNVFGNVYSRMLLPAKTLGAKNTNSFKWNGELFKYFKLGANIRAGERRAEISGRPDQSEWDLRRANLYFAIEPIENKILLYTDGEFAQGDHFDRETWLRWNFTERFYVRGGRIFLPFGLRIEDDTAFIRQIPGINFTTPDDGVEFGYDDDNWSVQLAVSDGTAGGPEIDNGKQVSVSAVYVQPKWRLGGSVNFNNSAAGDRELYGVFGGYRTGPVSWLAEIDYVVDMGFPEGKRNQIAMLLEGNWRIRKGFNLKLTYEHLDPDDTLDENQQNRWSGVLEIFPVQFFQVRLGIREYDGIPQSAVQNRSESFLQLHAYF